MKNFMRLALVVLAAIVTLVATIVVTPTAAAQEEGESENLISIPVETPYYGEGVHDVVTVDTLEYSGMSCTISSVTTNNDSVNENVEYIISSNGQSVVLYDVERSSSLVVYADGTLVMGDVVTVRVKTGWNEDVGDYRASGGIVVQIKCQEPEPVLPMLTAELVADCYEAMVTVTASDGDLNQDFILAMPDGSLEDGSVEPNGTITFSKEVKAQQWGTVFSVSISSSSDVGILEATVPSVEECSPTELIPPATAERPEPKPTPPPPPAPAPTPVPAEPKFNG